MSDEFFEKIISILEKDPEGQVLITDLKFWRRRLEKCKAQNMVYMMALNRPITINVYQNGEVDEKG